MKNGIKQRLGAVVACMVTAVWGGLLAVLPLSVKAAKVLEFNGTDAYVYMNHMYQGLTDMTIEAWIKTDVVNPALVGSVAGCGYLGGYKGFGLLVNVSGKLAYQNRQGSGSENLIQLTGDTVNDGQWHHVVGVRDASAQKMFVYIDGNEVARSDETVDISVVDHYFGIGARHGSGSSWGYFFDGRITEVRL